MEIAIEGDRKRAGRLRPEDRQKQLLKCAIKEFAGIGIGATVHADVARRAHVSVPTVFQYFSSRELLIISVISEVERFLIDILNNAVVETSTSAENIRAILEAFAAAVDERPDYIKIWMNWSTIVAEPTWSRYVKFQDSVLTQFEKLIEQGKTAGDIHLEIDATMGAHLIMGSGHMIAQMKFRHRDDEMVDTFIRSLISRALFSS